MTGIVTVVVCFYKYFSFPYPEWYMIHGRHTIRTGEYNSVSKSTQSSALSCGLHTESVGWSNS